MKKMLKNLIELSSNVKIYIPSNVKGIVIDSSEIVDQSLSLFSRFFGGATSYDALGCWQSVEQGLVKEKVIIIESFCNQNQLDENIENVIDYAELLKTKLSQDAIAIEVNNKLYFV